MAGRLDRAGSPSRFPVKAFILILAVVTILAHALLLPAGRWSADEYVLAVSTAQSGLGSFAHRVATQSPRPFAEFLTYLYLSASDTLNAPLIGPFLGVVWFGSLAGIALAGWFGRVPRPVWFAVVCFALALLIAKPGEMFYWPMAAAGYVPCWAALAAATALHSAPLKYRRIGLPVALVVAAFCVEVGALTVLIYGGLVSLGALRRRALRPVLPLALPMLCAAAVCLLVLTNRMQGAREVLDAKSGLAGHWGRSLAAALPVFARASLEVAGLPLLCGLALKLLLMLASPAEALGSERRLEDMETRGAWALALGLGAFLSVVLAFHEFGDLCCERHETLRQGMVLLALITVGGLIGATLWLPKMPVLAVVMAILMVCRAGPLLADWHDEAGIIATRSANWRSGLGQGPAMTVLVGPAGHVIDPDELPPGRYRTGSDATYSGDTPWYAWGVMARFGKHSLTVAPIAGAKTP